MNLELKIADALDPMIDELVTLEKAQEVTTARLSEFEKRLDESIAAAKVGASEEARAAIDEAVAPLKADLRNTFSDAIREVKSITEEAISAASRQVSSIATSIEAREKTAMSVLISEAQRYGA